MKNLSRQKFKYFLMFISMKFAVLVLTRPVTTLYDNARSRQDGIHHHWVFPR